jgi:uncharacterized repeat protein (TIGR03803 family)
MALIADANGDLFGTTSSGGAYGYGMVFEIANPGDIDLTVYNGKAWTRQERNASRFLSRDAASGEPPR